MPPPILYVMGLLVLGTAVLVPFLMIVKASFLVAVPGGEAVATGLAGWQRALSDQSVHNALWNTLLLTLATQVISIPIAVVCSWLLGRTNLPGRNWLEFGFWVSFFLPALGVLQGWILLLDGKFGLINVVLQHIFGLSTGPLNIYSWSGIVFAHLVTTALSAKVMMMTPAFQNMDSRFEDAGRMAGDGAFATLRKIVVPILGAAILVASVMGIIRTLESFEIELVLGVPSNVRVYSTLIYQLIHSDHPDYTTASALGVIVMVPMLALAITAMILTKRSRATISSQARYDRLDLGVWRWPAFTLVGGTVVLLTIVPIVFLCMSSVMGVFGYFNIAQVWTLEHWQAVLGDPIFSASLRSTLILATATMVTVVVFSTGIAYAIVRGPERLRAAFDVLSWVPFTMPGVIFSFALLWSFLQLGLMRVLYGSTLSLVIATTLATLTLGVQLVRSNLLQMGPELEQASWLSGASWLRTLRLIIVPLLMRSLVVVGVMSFISAARNISSLALLSSSDNQPLAVLQLQYMVEGRYEEASVIGIIVVAFTVGIAYLARRLGFAVGSGRTAIT